MNRDSIIRKLVQIADGTLKPQDLMPKHYEFRVLMPEDGKSGLYENGVLVPDDFDISVLKDRNGRIYFDVKIVN